MLKKGKHRDRKWNNFKPLKMETLFFFLTGTLFRLHQMWGLVPRGEQTLPFDGIHWGLEEGLWDFLPLSHSCHFFCHWDELGQWQLCFCCGFCEWVFQRPADGSRFKIPGLMDGNDCWSKLSTLPISSLFHRRMPLTQYFSLLPWLFTQDTILFYFVPCLCFILQYRVFLFLPKIKILCSFW